MSPTEAPFSHDVGVPGRPRSFRTVTGTVETRSSSTGSRTRDYRLCNSPRGRNPPPDSTHPHWVLRRQSDREEVVREDPDDRRTLSGPRRRDDRKRTDGITSYGSSSLLVDQ